jgi:hypothetical protein
MESRYISNKVKREVLENQNYKCARIKDYNFKDKIIDGIKTRSWKRGIKKKHEPS